MRLLLTLIPLTLFSSACQPIKVNRPPPPADKLVCAELPAKPDLSALEAFTTADGVKVYPKAATDARDAKISEYIVALRGAHFSCKSQLGWNRNYWSN